MRPWISRGGDGLWLLAIISMTVDHLTATGFFPREWTVLGRSFGRLALPIFLHLAIVGVRRTSDMEGWFLRMACLSAVSQVPYLPVFGSTISIIPTLTMVGTLIWWWDRARHRFLVLAAMVVATAVWSIVPTDAGVESLLSGILMGVATSPWHVVVAGIPLAILNAHVFHPLLGMLVLLAVAFPWQDLDDAVCRRWPALNRLPIPRWFRWGFYPGHLALLALGKILRH